MGDGWATLMVWRSIIEVRKLELSAKQTKRIDL